MINVGVRTLSLDDFADIVLKDTKIEISTQTIEKMEANFRFLSHFSDQKLIYGLIQGLAMAQYKVSQGNVLQLQYNLIRSHCSSATFFPLHLQSADGCASQQYRSEIYSGVHTDVAIVLKSLINNNITPAYLNMVVWGASGDLVQLAHLAFVLIGEGEVLVNGKPRPSAEVFKEYN